MQESNHKQQRNKRRKKPHYQSPTWGELNEEEKPEALLVGCTGKRRYPDLLAAHAAGLHMSDLTNNTEVYLYLCEHCHGYHLTKAQLAPDGKLNRWVHFFGKEDDVDDG